MGCLVKIRLIGVIEAEQQERNGTTCRNDRLIARVAKSITYDHTDRIDDPGNLFASIWRGFASTTMRSRTRPSPS